MFSLKQQPNLWDQNSFRTRTPSRIRWVKYVICIQSTNLEFKNNFFFHVIFEKIKAGARRVQTKIEIGVMRPILLKSEQTWSNTFFNTFKRWRIKTSKRPQNEFFSYSKHNLRINPPYCKYISKKSIQFIDK